MSSLNTTRRNKTFRGSTKKRTRSLEPPKKNTIEEIGSGGYGTVSRPAARCDIFRNKNFNKNTFRSSYYNNPDYVSKFTTRVSATKELDISNYIKLKIPDYPTYFCLVEFICNAPKDKFIIRNKELFNTYAILPYCGVTFNKILDDELFTITKLCKLLGSIQMLTKGLQKLHSNYIYHKDIHGDNILYDSESQLLRFIDFGLSRKYIDINNTSDILKTSEYSDLSTFIDRIIMRYVETIEERNNIRTNNPAINKFYIQINKFNTIVNEINNSESSLKKINNKLEKMRSIINYFIALKGIDEL